MKFTNITKLIAFCVLLLVVRVLKTGHFSFLFLLWNLFLAWLPYWLIKKYKPSQDWMTRCFFLGASLLFLPNSPYIITDLFHLTKKLVAPMWFDLILILSFAMVGLVYFLLTVERLLAIVRPYFKSETGFQFIKVVLLLANGYGIYLGRYLRFNSWDIIYKPNELAVRMFQSVFHPDKLPETFSVTVLFSVFLYLIFELYQTLKTSASQSYEPTQEP